MQVSPDTYPRCGGARKTTRAVVRSELTIRETAGSQRGEGMYYHGFQKKFPSSSAPWTQGDDQLVGLLFSKIVTRTAGVTGGDPPELADEMAHNLFDLMLYINKDFHSC
jgi:hypothetical protein